MLIYDVTSYYSKEKGHYFLSLLGDKKIINTVFFFFNFTLLFSIHTKCR